jgi:hypothetical protein
MKNYSNLDEELVNRMYEEEEDEEGENYNSLMI